MTLAISPREALTTTVLDALTITTTGVHVDIQLAPFHSRCEVADHDTHQPHAAAEITWTHREDGVQHDMACPSCIAEFVQILDTTSDLDRFEAITLKISAWYLRYTYSLDV